MPYSRCGTPPGPTGLRRLPLHARLNSSCVGGSSSMWTRGMYSLISLVMVGTSRGKLPLKSAGRARAKVGSCCFCVGLTGPCSQILVRWKIVPSLRKAECPMVLRRFVVLARSSCAKCFLVAWKSRCHGRISCFVYGFLPCFPMSNTAVARAFSNVSTCCTGSSCGVCCATMRSASCMAAVY